MPVDRDVRVKIYPTLNLQHGRLVPTSGEAGTCADTPLALTSRLLDGGATRLALVDLDAAQGHGNNRELIAQLLRHCHARDRKVCVQVAGGIRSSDQAQFFIDQGAAWLVAGTILHKSPMVAEQLMARFQSHLTAAIDARSGRVQRSGWVDATSLSALDLALRAKEYGFRRLLYIDIPEDPASEPDFATGQQMATLTGLPVIMGGSLTQPAHLERIPAHPGVKGALVDALRFQEDPRLMAFLQAACA